MSIERTAPMLTVQVWDLATRVYHWAQAGLVAAALATGYLAPAWWLDVHVWAGYAIAALVLFRLVWGLLGPEYSRFASFLYRPDEIHEHVRGLMAGRSLHAVGHNPLGALMVFAVIAVLVAILASGLVTLGGVENQGPLAGFAGFATGVLARKAHEALALLLCAMIVLHVLGVVAESRLSRQALVAAMISGRKTVPATAVRVRPRAARYRAAIIATVVLGAAFMLAGSLAARVPPSGLVPMAPNAAFEAECGACHEAYHPSLLPRASWSALMAGLDDHFGEDASLAPGPAETIAAWLETHASEAWDTEAANRLRRVDPAEPARITAAPFWTRTHREIDPAVFEAKAVGGKGHCAACHRDAASGRFDDQKIAIPARETTP